MITASLDAYIATSTSPNASSAVQTNLCVSVQTSQTSIQRGQAAKYTVTISTVNGSASNVTVTLTAQPTGQQPTFTSGCAKGNGGASCTISSVSDKQSASLQAQIPVAASAKSVTSVRLTATASVATSAKWTPPAAAETVAVTAASPSASASASSTKSSSAGASPVAPPPLGPVPNPNNASSSLIGPGNASSSLIGPGNASGLFPAVLPGSTPSPTVGTGPGGSKRNADPVSNSSTLALGGTQVLPAQVAGLIALALALLLTMTRLSLRRRSAAKGAAPGAKGQDTAEPAPPVDGPPVTS